MSSGFEHSIPASISYQKMEGFCRRPNRLRHSEHVCTGDCLNIYLRNFSVKSEQKLVFTFAFETHRFSGKWGFFFLSWDNLALMNRSYTSATRFQANFECKHLFVYVMRGVVFKQKKCWGQNISFCARRGYMILVVFQPYHFFEYFSNYLNKVWLPNG